LFDVSGAAPYTGIEGFTSPEAGLYLLGINPRSRPGDDETPHETVRQATKRICDEGNILYNCHVDDKWRGNEAGTMRSQIAMQHVFQEQLGFDLRRIPVSNIIFSRSGEYADLSNPHQLAEDCRPFHQAVIDDLDIQSIIVMGTAAWNYVSKTMPARVAATAILSGVNPGSRQFQMRAADTPDGRRIIHIPHFGGRGANWLAEGYDPSFFINDHLILQ